MICQPAFDYGGDQARLAAAGRRRHRRRGDHDDIQLILTGDLPLGVDGPTPAPATG